LRARSLFGVLAGVVAVLFGLELVYLAVGNAVVRSQAIKRAVGSADGFMLDYGSAYTLWPGHVRVRDFSLRVEDYNVQFEVALSDAELDIDLARLPFKTFRVTRLDASGVRFRMRHKLISVGDDAERVAAFPPIRGFADPPYFRGVRPPPIPDSEYDLWQVHIENVTARVQELWVMEYRLRGSGTAHGSFVVKPARWVQVRPASLDIASGTLSLGDHLVAGQVRGRLACDVGDLRVQEREGRQVLSDISASVQLDLIGGKLDFVSAYLSRFGAVRYAGNAEWALDLDVKHGVVQPGSQVMMRAEPLVLRHSLGEARGRLALSLARDPRLAPDRLQLALTAPELRATRAESPAAGPTLEALAAGLELYAVDLAGDMSLGAGQVAVRRIDVPDLGWFAPPGTSLSGRGAADFSVAREPNGDLDGRAHLELEQAALTLPGFAARADVASDVAISGAPHDLHAERLRLLLNAARLTSDGKQSEPFSLRLDGAGLRLRPADELQAQGQLRLHVSSADALLPLVMSNPWRDLSSTALDLETLEARAQLQLRRSSFELHRIDAHSGGLRVRGYLSKGEQQPHGALLLSSGPFNVGLTLSDGNTEVSPFVGDDWLRSAGQRFEREPGKG
jgi:hypothetical protein